MIARTEDFIGHVAAHAGVSTDRAEHATHAVLSGIGGFLSPSVRQLVAEEVPPALGALLLAGSELVRPLDDHPLEPGMSAGQTHELIASVCHVLAEVLSTDALRALHSAAPLAIASLLEPPGPEVVHQTPAPRRRETLATGRPGSHRSLSEARPERRHGDSIAADNPHGAVKLSSAPGSTQERRHETLAEGHPTAERSFAGSRR